MVCTCVTDQKCCIRSAASEVLDYLTNSQKLIKDTKRCLIATSVCHGFCWMRYLDIGIIMCFPTYWGVRVEMSYEPADLTVHPPPPKKKLSRVCSFFLYRCLVFPKKMSSKRGLYFSETFRLKKTKTWCLSTFT